MTAPPTTTRPCRDCPFGACEFSVRHVYLYLICMRQAKILGEPFEVVYQHRVRNSRLIDPAIRGAWSDPDQLRAIGWALEAVQRTHGIDVTNAHNAARVAELLCPERHNEVSVDDEDF